MSSYTYSIATDTPNALVNLDSLAEAIEASTISATLSGINTSGDELIIVFQSALTSEETISLNGLVAAHDGAPTPELPEPELDAEGYPVTRIKGLYVDTSKAFYGRGFSGTVTAGTVGNVDLTLPVAAHIDAISIYVKDQAWGDKVAFQIVHPIAGVVNDFAADWYINSSREKQEIVNPPQISGLIPAGMIIRVAYTSVGSTDVQVNCNLHLQEPIV